VYPFLAQKPPLFIRQFAADLAGNFLRDRGMEGLGDLVGSREINAGDLSATEYRALQESVLRSMDREGSSRGSDTWQLNYDDYGLDDLADYISIAAPGAVPQKFRGEVETRRAEHEQALRDQGHSQSFIDNLYAQGPFSRVKSAQILKDLEGSQGPLEALMSSPSAFSLAGSIGSARIRKDPETGEYWIEDEYDFNDAANLAEDASFWADAAKEGFIPTPGNLYGQARNLGKYYGSQPGEGSSIRINLGTLEDLHGDIASKEKGPSRMARGLGWLRGLVGRDDRDDDVRLAERRIPPIDESAMLRERLERLDLGTPPSISIPDLDLDVQ